MLLIIISGQPKGDSDAGSKRAISTVRRWLDEHGLGGDRVWGEVLRNNSIYIYYIIFILYIIYIYIVAVIACGAGWMSTAWAATACGARCCAVIYNSHNIHIDFI